MGVKFENNKYYIDEDYIIRRQIHSAGAKPHTHDFIELSYIKKGHCVHIIDGHEYLASKGDMVFVNYNSLHAIPAGSGAEYINIMIKPEFIDHSLKGSENAFSILALSDFKEFSDIVQHGHLVINFSGREREKTESLLERIDDELRENSQGSEFIIRNCINILLTTVFRKMELPMKSNSVSISTLPDYVKSNCTSSLSIEKLAVKYGYNAAYFSRLFKNLTGKTFTEYISACRVEYACKLLRESDLSVEDVMNEAGFSNRTKFFRDFSKITGKTPLNYKKENALK
ncbi:MAG: helix-turn-helix domain-containing protein [Ruminococcaceae bacterium]|nr:helix-turn-helix domain-containing protein [Oscillospiraceae bacterium]